MIPAGFESHKVKTAYESDESFYDDDEDCDEEYGFTFSSNRQTVQSQALKDSTRFDAISKREEENRTVYDEFNNNSYDYANKNDMQEPEVDKSLEELHEKIRQSIRQKNLDKFKFLFESNKLDANMALTTTADWSLLMYAVSNGAYDICKYLVENGADSTYTDDSFSLLMCACACEDSHVLESDLLNIAQLLIEHNADVNQTDK